MNESNESPGIATRGFELGVALFLCLVGVLVVTDSLRVGTGWADDGPRSGYFPFYIGCGLVAASAWVAVKQLLRWKAEDPVFATRAELGQVAVVLVPMIVYVAAIAGLGIYVASALLIGWFMRRLGHYGWRLTAAVALGVPLACFAIFERWFLVPLPKGPLESLIGL